MKKVITIETEGDSEPKEVFTAFRRFCMDNFQQFRLEVKVGEETLTEQFPKEIN